MTNGARETGWQRFLDRLKELWGKSRRGGLAPASIAMLITRARARLRLQRPHH
jgi:hypothetical protein